MLFQHVAGIDQRGTTVCSLKTKIWTFNGACVKASSRCKGDRGESTLLLVAPSRSRLVWVERERYIHKGGETFRLMVPLTLVLEVFLEIFIRERESEPRSGEERGNPLVTLTSNLIFMQTTGSGCDRRARSLFPRENFKKNLWHALGPG